jgi:glutathione S-transferase
MLKLYGDRYSGNCYKVRLLMGLLGIGHEWVEIDVTKQETRTAAFLALNPAGQIPLLQLDSGACLPESNAILHYLAEGSALLPGDAFEHAQVLRWMFFEQYTHEPSVASARYIVRYLGRPPQHEERLKQRIADSYLALGIMEQHLNSTPFFVAGRYSIADISLFAYTHVAHEGAIDLAAFPAVRSWIARVEDQPGHVAMGA